MVDPTIAARRRHTDYLQTTLELDLLVQRYNEAYQWLPRVAIESPDAKPDEILKEVRDRMAELRLEKKQLRAAVLQDRREQLSRRTDWRSPMPVRPIRTKVWPQPTQGDVQLARAGLVSMEDYLAEQTLRPGSWQGYLAEHLAEIPPDRVDGIVRASAFRRYVDHPTNHSGTRSLGIFLPYGGSSDPGNFVGSVGLQFDGMLHVEPGLITDPPDMFSFAGVLQYTLPEAPMDGGMQWSVQQCITVPRVDIDADFGLFAIWPLARQSPNGDEFPDDLIEGFGSDLGPSMLVKVWGDGEAGPLAVTDVFRSGCVVSKGQRPRIYVGLTIMLWVVDGTMTIDDPSLACHVASGGYAGLSYSYFKF